MRSAFTVLSLSISAPQRLAILSSSLAEIAAKHGAGSIGGSLSVSVPVAKPRLGNAMHARKKTTARIRNFKRSRIHGPAKTKAPAKGLPQNPRPRCGNYTHGFYDRLSV